MAGNWPSPLRHRPGGGPRGEGDKVSSFGLSRGDVDKLFGVSAPARLAAHVRPAVPEAVVASEARTLSTRVDGFRTHSPELP